MSSPFASASPISPIRGCLVSELLREAARRWPDREAVVLADDGSRVSFRELDARATRIAAAAIAAGLAPGDRAVVYAFNSIDWVAVQYGLARAGVVLVTANTALKRDELGYILGKCGARAIFFGGGTGGGPAGAPPAPPVPPVNDLPAVVAAQDPAALPRLRSRIGLAGARARGSVAFEEFLEAGAASIARVEAVEQTLDRDDVINMQYTSGTTGFPKGVMLSHRNLVENAAAIQAAIPFVDGDRLCLAVPLFHCFGCVIGTLRAHGCGVPMIVHSRFQADAILDAVERERATALYGVPTMFTAELEAQRRRPRDLSSLRIGVMAGATCPESLMRAVTKEFPLPGLGIAYGLTEASPGVTASSPDDPIDVRATTVGRALPGIEVGVFDPATAQRLPPGARGELWTRGEHVMAGYDGEEEATRAAITGDGWLRTGDLAVERPDGRFEIVGRIKELIIRGGENISPAEIEEVLRRHPAVADAAVFAIASDFFGEDVAAAIRLKDGESATAESLRGFVKERLADHKAPARVVFVDAFPLTGSGKVQKFRLREQVESTPD